MSRSSRRQLPCGVAPFKDDLAKTKKRLAEVKAGKDAAAVKAARPELNNGWLLRPPAGAQPAAPPDVAQPAASTVIAAAVPQVVLITETPAPGGGGKGGGMQIFIKTVTGKTTTLDVACCDTIKIVKQMIQAKEGIPADHLRLTYRCKQLEDDRTLADYNVDAQATLGLFTRNGSLNVLARRAELEQLRRLAELSQAEAKAAQPTAPPDVAQPAASTVDVRTGRAKGIADARATLARRMRRADRLCLAARTDAVNRSEADVVRKKAKSIKSAIHPWIHHDFVLESIGIDALYNEMREKARELQVVAVVASTSRTHTADAFAVGGTAATVCLEGIPSNAYAATVGMLREFVGSADRRHKLRDLAPDWAQPMPVPDGDHKHVLEQLDSGSREYMDIDDKFHNQGTRPFWPGTGTIERIDRVVNVAQICDAQARDQSIQLPPIPPGGRALGKRDHSFSRHERDRALGHLRRRDRLSLRQRWDVGAGRVHCGKRDVLKHLRVHLRRWGQANVRGVRGTRQRRAACVEPRHKEAQPWISVGARPDTWFAGPHDVRAVSGIPQVPDHVQVMWQDGGDSLSRKGRVALQY